MNKNIFLENHYYSVDQTDKHIIIMCDDDENTYTITENNIFSDVPKEGDYFIYKSDGHFLYDKDKTYEMKKKAQELIESL